MKYYFLFFLFCILQASCTDEQKAKTTLFKEINITQSNLDFVNEIIEDNETNFYRYQYLYNGGGVGIGDINNDGLPDIYFTSTIGNDRLYLNKGNLKFEDITKSAGIDQSIGFKSGVSMVDINADGWLDIYICRAGWDKKHPLSNLLFINQQNNTFKESGEEYGINSSSHSVQAGFLDYDRDGDLDMYLANHPGIFEVPWSRIVDYMDRKPMRASDQFFRNDNGKFTDITNEVGIQNYSYSLGLAIADINDDGWTDLYIANDFEQPDFYYINNGNGTFTESLRDYFPHCSYFSMGSEICDINNDGHLDIFVVEMLAEDNLRQKTNMAPMDTKRFDLLIKSNMYYQYMRNAMHLNKGNGHFGDVADYAGLAQTDWSWGTIAADFDHDGDVDITVANGYLNDTQDKDYGKKKNSIGMARTFSDLHNILPSTRIKNYAFENQGNLKFNKVSDQWGFNFSGYSNGMATADLDNDGDLDLVVNNINDPASLYENTINDKNYLNIRLKGKDKNMNGLNAKVKIFVKGKQQVRSLQSVRGFQSSSDPKLHFGVTDPIIDSLIVQWDDGNVQKLENVKTGQELVIEYIQSNIRKANINTTYLVAHDNNLTALRHQENEFNDYRKQVLLPHKLSQMGPALATGDFDKNGLEDIFLGGGSTFESQLWLQTTANRFEKSEQAALEKDKYKDDVDALFFDYDNDGDLDLYVVSGGNEFGIDHINYQDRLYKNNNGILELSELPEIKSSGMGVSAGDYDQDGDLDLFIGSRHTPGKYPYSSSSTLLKNENGTFVNVTSEVAPSMMQAGMINSSTWTDYDGDGDLDLLCVGEWTGLKIFRNEDGKFSDKSMTDHKGWWNTIEAIDLNNDGFDDYILGNLGLNYKYKASEEAPFEIYANDFDENGKSDIVLGYYNEEEIYPVRGFQCSSEQLPDLKKKVKSYKEFGSKNIFEVYGASLDSSLHLRANTFASMIAWNKGNGEFEFKKLPLHAQLSPIQSVLPIDINSDGLQDLILAGNWYVSEIETPRADAGSGVVLLNKGNQEWENISVNKSGLFLPGDVRKMVLMQDEDNKPIIMTARNNDKVSFHRLQ